MRIDTKCSIGIHCMILIAAYGDKYKITSEIISRSTGCNQVVIRTILGNLKKNGLIQIARGVGGATLNVNMSEISIWDVYHAVEQKSLDEVIGIHPNPLDTCPVGDCIEDILKEPYQEIGNAIKIQMEQYKLDKLMEEFYHREPDWEEAVKKNSVRR